MTPTWLAGMVAVATVVGTCAPVSTEAATSVLTGYGITSWGQKDGLPSSVIFAVAQDPDGFLWVGTDGGLVRFDGLRFSPWDPSHVIPLPSAPVRALLSAGDGSVWVGFAEPGGVDRIRPGEQRHYGPAEGLGAGAVTLLFEDPVGTVWAGNTAGLFRFGDERWERVAHGLPDGPVYSLHVDNSGDFHVGTATGVFRRSPRSVTFERVDAGEARDLETDHMGRLWVSDPLVGFRLLHEHPTPSSFDEQGRGRRLLRDTSGNLWVGTGGQGLWRIRLSPEPSAPRVEKATALTGLSNDAVVALMEDREGNIWAATLDGLNRLTPHKATQVTDLGLVSGVEAAPDGNVWIGTVDAVLPILAGDLDRPRRAPIALGAALLAMHIDERGGVWAATNQGLLRIDRSGRSIVPMGARAQPSRISAIASDFRGGVWLADAVEGLLRWNNGRTTRGPLPAVPRGIEIVSMKPDRRGRVWMIFADGRIAAIERDHTVRVFDAADGLGTGPYRAVLHGRDDVLWFGGTDSLTRFVSGRFETIGQESGLPPGEMTAILEDDTGALWIGLESAGIVRIRRHELDQASADRSHVLRYTSYDRSDGLAGTPQWYSSSSGTRTRDGRLWFVSGRGLTIIDPGVLDARAVISPPVRIDGVAVNGEPVSLASFSSLPSRLARLELGYTVLNLTSPIKTRFRYRLDGFDNAWVEAGIRREAVYTNLPPGPYEFRVEATDAEGVWNEPGAAWAFSIAPAFYQTLWFVLVCVTGIVLTVGAAWRLHLLQVQRRFALVLNERARLSREIHDTLLQSMVGLALQVDVIGGDLEAAPAMSKERLVRLRKDLNAYIREARQSIRDLRSPMLEQCDLAKALRQTVEHLTAGTPLGFELIVAGTPRRCPPKVEEQLLRIGQEAVTNALRHGLASKVVVMLQYDDDSVALHVTDNGSGFDLAQALSSDDGHVGLTIMKERAEDIGGAFQISSVIGKGTEVHATVPAPQRS